MTNNLSIIDELEKLGALTSTSLKLPPGTSYERVEALFAYFGKVHGAVRFYIGDLLAFSEDRFGEDKMYQAAEATGLTEKTLHHYLLVAGRVAPARRRENLSFSIHAEVARAAPGQQAKWLKLAEENDWSVRQIRQLLHDEGVIEPPRSSPQWTPGVLSGGAGNGAQGDPATGVSLPSETAPASPSSSEPEPWRSDLLAPRHDPRAVTLAKMRDELGEAITRGEPLEIEEVWGLAFCEQRRDALVWALETLAPELA